MSFLTDLFEGNFGNLGNDISHTFSSLASHPDELAETLGVGALVAAPFVLPELGAAIGIGGAADAAGAGAADAAVAGATDIGIADAAGGLTSDAILGGVAADAGVGAVDALSLSPAIDSGALGATGFLDAGTASDVIGGGDQLLSGDLGAGGGGTEFNLDAAQQGTSPTWQQQYFSSANPLGTTTPAAGDLGGAAAGDTITAAPAAASAAPAAAAGGGATSTLSSILSSPWTKLAMAGAPLALTLAMGETQLPASAQALQAQALQMQQTGLTNLAQAQAGILNAGQTAQIAQMQQGLMNQWLQTLANQGVKDPTKDSRWPQILADVDQKVTAATAQLIQQNITNALQETGQAASALTSIAQMQMTADQNFTNALINATKSLGLLAGLGTKTTTTTTTA